MDNAARTIGSRITPTAISLDAIVLAVAAHVLTAPLAMSGLAITITDPASGGVGG
jgi:hypothetical protein